jgi:hypothetical protein
VLLLQVFIVYINIEKNIFNVRLYLKFVLLLQARPTFCQGAKPSQLAATTWTQVDCAAILLGWCLLLICSMLVVRSVLMLAYSVNSLILRSYEQLASEKLSL